MALNDHEATAECLRQEATALLDTRGLRGLLANYGAVHPHGSFALDLLVWRDLDIYLVAPDIAVADFFRLGSEVADLLSPVRMSFRNERIALTPSLPEGLYWGIYLQGELGWKIDVWAMPAAAYERVTAYERSVAQRLTGQSRTTILWLKTAFWQHPSYRQSFAGKDIYDAVLDAGVEDQDAFIAYLQGKGIGLAAR